MKSGIEALPGRVSRRSVAADASLGFIAFLLRETILRYIYRAIPSAWLIVVPY